MKTFALATETALALVRLELPPMTKAEAEAKAATLRALQPSATVHVVNLSAL